MAQEKVKSREVEDPVKNGNTVLIGRKPVMNYVVACITFFNAGKKEVIIKARGMAISRAVDSIELLRRAFVKDLVIRKIEIDTESLVGVDGRNLSISTMEIRISKTEAK